MKDLDWQILYELKRNPNITQVAKLLYKTQSAVTKRLQNIEDEYGTAIVERTSKGLLFTEEGDFLSAQAEKYIQLDRETREGLRLLRSRGQESLTIGSAYTYAKYSLDAMLEPFSESHPNLNYRIINKQSDILHEMVLKGELDAAFIRDDFTDGVNHTLLEYTSAYCLSREAVDLSHLPEMERVAYQTNEKAIQLLRGWWQERFGTDIPGNAEDAGYIEFAFRAVKRRNKYLLCFLPENFVNEYGLCMQSLLRKDGSPLMRRTWFIYGMKKRRRPILEELVRYVESKAVKQTREKK